MILVRMEWGNLKMTMEGHAGTAEKGHDLVCAGASMLAQALGRSLQIAQARGRLDLQILSEEGMMRIQADPELSSLNETKAYFRMFLNGMRMLAEEYPANVKVKEV